MQLWNWRIHKEILSQIKTKFEDILVQHYEEKFKFPEVHSAPNILQDVPKVVSEEENPILDDIPLDEEIKRYFFELDPGSAPGPYGFAGWFYRFACEVIGEDLTKAIQYCWRGGFIPKGLNSNFLFLLPKVKNEKRTSQFILIGLMNFSFQSVYKDNYYKI